ncbi:MAG: hypothetical protein EPN17_15535 [Methylobacter sp.]|nr:MAG: hypothetical protein EPN17_15535 [Methylobacter sp.]
MLLWTKTKSFINESMGVTNMAIKLGTANNDPITGAAGWDTLYGLGGNDTLSGLGGRDILSGGDGNDVLEGGASGDSLHGGGGNDVFKYTNITHVSGDKIVDFSAGDTLNFSAIGGLSFIGNAQFSGVAGQIRYSSSYNSTTLTIDSNGDAEYDVSLQFTGPINLTETAPGSQILKLATNQSLNGTANGESLSGEEGNDTLSGLSGNDTLSGGDGSDVLQGGDGNDILEGGLSADTLTGGNGADTFRFTSADDFSTSSSYYGADTISDFGSGDQIVIDVPGFSYIGDAIFSGIPGQYRVSGDQLAFDFDGDKSADSMISLPNITSSKIALEETKTGSNQLTIAANQTFTGTAANNTLLGGNGYDTLTGFAGNDSLSGGAFSDMLDGGDGNDTLIGGSSPDTMSGGAGNDVFIFNSLDELGDGSYAYGGYNRDTITDFAKGDKINLSAISGLTFVGVGNDFSGVANQVRIYDDYNATLLQIDTNGDKSADFSLALPDNLTIEEPTADSGIFQVAEDKVLPGKPVNDTLLGGNGNDSLTGLAGNDSLVGGFGADTLDGGDGNDTLFGGLGADNLTGGSGNDVFKYNSPTELGDGSYMSSGSYNRDTITDFAMGDKINLSALSGLSFVGIGNNFSGSVNQVRVYDDYNATLLQIDTTGDKFADYSIALPDNLTIEETSSGIFQIAENQVLTGSAQNDTLPGGNGNDSLTGLAGNDSLTGGYGADTLNGGDGADTLIGGLGNDNLTGGSGNDVFKYSSLAELGSDAYSNRDSITDLAAGDKINLSALSGLTFVGIGNDFSGMANQVRVYDDYNATQLQVDTNGDTYADYSIALPDNLTLEETTPGSMIFQVAENQILTGTSKNNNLIGGNGNDTLNGFSGNDTLTGGYGADTLMGGDGADTLVGGLGTDNLTGGAGNDIFKYTSVADLGNNYPYETITDLAAGDKIDLSAIDADPQQTGDQAFSFLGTSGFTGAGGELYYSYGSLYGDVNGDTYSDFSIAISGSPVLAASDFIL